MRMSVRSVRLFAAAALATAVIAGAALAGALPASATAAPHWRVYLTSRQDLMEVTSTGPRSAWVTGDTSTGPYLLHWNGVRWQRQHVPGGSNFIAYQVQAASDGSVWVLGDTQGSQPEAQILTAGTWHTLALPPGSQAYDVAAVSGTQAWGLVAGQNDCFGDPVVCYPTVWHWSDGAFTTYPMRAGVVAITSAGSHVFVLGGGRAVYSANNAGLHQLPSVPVKAGEFPEIAASPGGKLWLVAMWGAKAHRSDTLSFWNGTAWSWQDIPAKSKKLTYGSGTGLSYDGRDGVWIGPYVHWTGKHWIRTIPAGPTSAYELMNITAIPGSGSAWAVGPAGAPRRWVLALYGARP